MTDFDDNPDKKCHLCRYFETIKYECRRRPPFRAFNSDGEARQSYWPLVDEDDWCGAFEWVPPDPDEDNVV